MAQGDSVPMSDFSGSGLVASRRNLRIAALVCAGALLVVAIVALTMDNNTTGFADAAAKAATKSAASGKASGASSASAASGADKALPEDVMGRLDSADGTKPLLAIVGLAFGAALFVMTKQQREQQQLA
mmetsp:Transcript_75696/g.177671  ORF Transcript_75696/g.177671 Transcript_75696/m.177671 type:complete len:129 (-) Transcript_75696:28-414(-)